MIHVVGDRVPARVPDRTGALRARPSDLDEQTCGSRHAGDQMAFVEHPVAGDQRGGVSVVGLDGQQAKPGLRVHRPRSACSWSPNGDEVWFSATRASGAPQQIHAVSLSGRERRARRGSGSLQALRRVDARRAPGVPRHRAGPRSAPGPAGPAQERRAAAADLSFRHRPLRRRDADARNGRRRGRRARTSPSTSRRPTALRRCGSEKATVRLCRRRPVRARGAGPAPSAAADRRPRRAPASAHARARADRPVFAGGLGPHRPQRRVRGNRRAGRERFYVQDVAGGPPRAVTEDDVALPRIGRPVSPDGRRVVARGSGRRARPLSARGEVSRSPCRA